MCRCSDAGGAQDAASDAAADAVLLDARFLADFDEPQTMFREFC